MFTIKKLEWLDENGSRLIQISSYNCLTDKSKEPQIDRKVEHGRLRLYKYEDIDPDMFYDADKEELQLYDNTSYVFSYEKNSDLIDSDLISELLNDTAGSRESGNNRRYTSINYVGELDLGISDFEIVIKSRNKDYDNDFTYLMEQIHTLCEEDLLSLSSSYVAAHFRKAEDYVKDRINYTEVSYLKEILRPGKLPTWVDYLIRHAEQRVEENEQELFLAEVEDPDPVYYLDGLIAGECFKTSKICGAAGKIGRAPIKIRTKTTRMTYDTRENQFVKFFLSYLYDILYDLRIRIGRNNGKIYKEVNKMYGVVDDIMGRPFWKLISDIESIPYNSQILQRKYPYNLIFQAYNDMHMSSVLSLGSVDKTFLSGQKNAPKLYEYWVYIKIFDYLNEKSNLSLLDWIKYDKEGFYFSLNEGGKYAEFILEDEKSVRLWYNKKYLSTNSIWQGRSYSHELKPDISLELFFRNELVALIHFDAKYKLPDKEGEEVKEDIDKMHAYKDGIMGTIGAYSVFLGDNLVKYDEVEKGESEGNVLFPSIGEIPLRLDNDKMQTDIKVIEKIIDSFCSLRIEKDINMFSEDRLEKYNALKRLIMRI